jgi:hypothetical protein
MSLGVGDDDSLGVGAEGPERDREWEEGKKNSFLHGRDI